MEARNKDTGAGVVTTVSTDFHAAQGNEAWNQWRVTITVEFQGPWTTERHIKEIKTLGQVKRTNPDGTCSLVTQEEIVEYNLQTRPMGRVTQVYQIWAKPSASGLTKPQIAAITALVIGALPVVEGGAVAAAAAAASKGISLGNLLNSLTSKGAVGGFRLLTNDVKTAVQTQDANWQSGEPYDGKSTQVPCDTKSPPPLVYPTPQPPTTGPWTPVNVPNAHSSLQPSGPQQVTRLFQPGLP